MSVTVRKHRSGLYLKSKDRRSSRNIAKKSVITNSKQLTQKKSADSYKDNYGDRNWNSVKLINKVLQKWKNYGNSRVLPSIRSRDENSSRIRNTILELSGRVQELQNEVNCMNDSKDVQDAESIRSGNSHITSRPVSFPPHPTPEGTLRHSFVTPSRREGPAKHLGTHMAYRETFFKIQMRHHQHLIHKNCISGIHRSKSRSIHPQWRKVKGKNKIKI